MTAKSIQDPTRKTIRQFGLTILIGFGMIGSVVFFKGQRTFAGGIWIGAVMICILSFLSVAASKPIYFAWMRLGALLGAVSSRIVTFIIYFLIFTPVAIFFRLKGRDILMREKSNKNSYWMTHPVIEDKDYYRHLF